MKLPSFLKDPQAPLFWLALLRIMLGLVFVTTWYSNLLKGFYTPDGLQNFFTGVFPQSENPLTWYAAFINNVILPARAVFAPFQLVSELLMGLALLVGFFTPLFSLGAIFFLINTFLATFGHDWPWAYLMPIGIAAACLLARAGRRAGLDAYLLKRFGEPKWPLW
jgi:uncharacterized membrane protein YphA (DoxX/SURF4 family)